MMFFPYLIQWFLPSRASKPSAFTTFLFRSKEPMQTPPFFDVTTILGVSANQKTQCKKIGVLMVQSLGVFRIPHHAR